MIAPASLNDGM